MVCQKALAPAFEEAKQIVEAAEQANLAIALYTPPVGGTLFVAAKLAGAGIGEITRQLMPMMAATFLVVILITYIPTLPMALVWLLR